MTNCIRLLAVFLLASSSCFAQPLVESKHLSYVTYWSLESRIPAVVIYTLDGSHFSGSERLKGRHFKQDPQLPPPRVKDSDYSGWGYVRGHLCPAGDRDSRRDWLKDTYSMANVVPMTMVTNSSTIKAVEDSCRALALCGHKLTVAVVPILNGNGIIPTKHGSIVVPSSILRLTRCTVHPSEYWAWMIPNSNEKSTAARITIHELKIAAVIPTGVAEILHRYGFPWYVIDIPTREASRK